MIVLFEQMKGKFMKKLIQKLNGKIYRKRMAWFFLIASLFLLFYSPHIKVQVNMDSTYGGTFILSHFNTDRGEEIFTNYRYTSHKSYYSVLATDDIIVDRIPLVTNSIRMELMNLKTMTIDSIDVSFGPFRLATYDADHFSEFLKSTSGLDISTDTGKIVVTSQGTDGWFQFQDTEYFHKTAWVFIYGMIMVFSWLLADLITKHIDFIVAIPLREVMLIAIPIWVFFMGELIIGSYYYIDIEHRMLNAAILIVLYKVVYLIFRRRAGTVAWCNFGWIIFCIVDTFVTVYRNRPIAPWDFSAIGTALDVATNYDYSITYTMVIALIMCFVLYFAFCLCPKDISKINKYYLIYPAMIICVAVFISSIGQYYLWDMNLLSVYETDGLALTFTGLTRQYLEDRPKKPDSYDLARMKKTAEQMRKDAKADVDPNGITPVNLIVIMNESFSDLDVGGTDYADGAISYFLNLDNTIRGNMYVSVRGGGTCNTEYETLTGNSTAFFQAGVYAYNMYMNRSVPSLVSVFNGMNYSTTGIHLGKATNWNRRTAYKQLGFQNTVFADNFDRLETVHGYPTDAQDYEVLEKQYQDHNDSPQFIFNVTYQNHGGYGDADDLTRTFDLKASGYYPAVVNYLSLLQLSDQAYKDLIAYYSKVDEPTMIVMYGDHQPGLGDSADMLFFPDAGTPETDMKEYITPFAIWANYDIPDQYIDRISANYMSALIMHAANLEKTPYQQYLYELYQKYPVISLYGCYDADGNFYDSVKDIKDDAVDMYHCFESNNVFDSEREDSFFSLDQ